MPDGNIGRLDGAEDAAYVHERTSVYTRAGEVERILDAVGWKPDANLSGKILVEPSAGAGAFLIEVANRLVLSLKRRNIPLDAEALAAQVYAWELDRQAATLAQIGVQQVFINAGLDGRTARQVADRWVQCGDFLLADLGVIQADVVVGNPPYMRWSRLPRAMRRAYEAKLPDDAARGDLLLPFLDRGICLLKPGGLLGFIVSDRWLHSAYAAAWRSRVMSQVEVRERAAVSTEAAFERPVDAYAERLVIERRRTAKSADCDSGPKLIGDEFEIRVGPALGCTPAYVLKAEEVDAVEQELLRPWVDGREVQEGAINWGGRKVITLYAENGGLIDLGDFPLIEAHIKRFESRLKSRSIIAKGAKPWWRPIDRLAPDPWSRPKLLFPELAKIPRIAWDDIGAIPSHGAYAIFHREDDEDALRKLLACLEAGGLAKALEDKAPKVKGGYVRCYEAVLRRL